MMNWTRFFLFFGMWVLFAFGTNADDRRSAYQSRTFYENLDIQAIQPWDSYEQIEKYFFLIRDSRFIEDPEVKGTYRRISLMLPDFCCEARAFGAIEFLKHYSSVPLPNKIFIFDDGEGSLGLKTSFSQQGSVKWIDHVALAVRVQDQVYVIDPAVEITRPLKLQEWISSISYAKSNLSFSICHPDTFDPFSNCVDPEPEYNRALRHQTKCLMLERKRVKKLGLVPDIVLGDNPPWSQ